MTQSIQIAEEICRTRRARKVLLVEDSRADAELTTYLLNEAGCVVTLCVNGELGVEAVRNNQFDIAILDVQLPGINGLEAARRIKLLDPELPIVICSGSYGNPNLVAAMEQGHIVVPKPFSLDKIKALSAGVGLFKS